MGGLGLLATAQTLRGMCMLGAALACCWPTGLLLRCHSLRHLLRHTGLLLLCWLQVGSD